ncbi:MAG: DapH/DapD/GlmU-related protein [Candidatus Brocadiia bacterium]
MHYLTHNFESVPAAELRRAGLAGLIRADMQAKGVWYAADGVARSLLHALVTDGSLCTVLYRLMGALRRWHLRPLAALAYKLNSLLSGAVIGRGARFGPGLVVLHSVGVVVNSAVRAGRNVIIESGVTIGAEKGGCPSIGDNVFIGSGAKLIGPIRVGSDVRIGANAVVLEDVPDGATVVGVPAKVVKMRDEEG